MIEPVQLSSFSKDQKTPAQQDGSFALGQETVEKAESLSKELQASVTQPSDAPSNRKTVIKLCSQSTVQVELRLTPALDADRIASPG